MVLEIRKYIPQGKEGCVVTERMHDIVSGGMVILYFLMRE